VVTVYMGRVCVDYGDKTIDWLTGLLAYWLTGLLAYWLTGLLAYWQTYWPTIFTTPKPI